VYVARSRFRMPRPRVATAFRSSSRYFFCSGEGSNGSRNDDYALTRCSAVSVSMVQPDPEAARSDRWGRSLRLFGVIRSRYDCSVT